MTGRCTARDRARFAHLDSFFCGFFIVRVSIRRACLAPDDAVALTDFLRRIARLSDRKGCSNVAIARRTELSIRACGDVVQ
jgi:hypothetical protein